MPVSESTNKRDLRKKYVGLPEGCLNCKFFLDTPDKLLYHDGEYSIKLNDPYYFLSDVVFNEGVTGSQYTKDKRAIIIVVDVYAGYTHPEEISKFIQRSAKGMFDNHAILVTYALQCNRGLDVDDISISHFRDCFPFIQDTISKYIDRVDAVIGLHKHIGKVLEENFPYSIKEVKED